MANEYTDGKRRLVKADYEKLIPLKEWRKLGTLMSSSKKVKYEEVLNLRNKVVYETVDGYIVKSRGANFWYETKKDNSSESEKADS